MNERLRQKESAEQESWIGLHLEQLRAQQDRNDFWLYVVIVVLAVAVVFW
jgi:hypothetical protein